MPSEHSFDVVSKVNLQELRNSVQQAQKEVVTRFDFKGTSAGLDWEESSGTLKLTADHDVQMKSVIDLVQTKMVKRGVSVLSFTWKDLEQLPSGHVKQQASLQQGLSSEKAKEVVKVIKDLGLKIQPRIDGESVRVVGKQLDDLQAAMQALKAKDFGAPLQFENYR